MVMHVLRGPLGRPDISDVVNVLAIAADGTLVASCPGQVASDPDSGWDGATRGPDGTFYAISTSTDDGAPTLHRLSADMSTWTEHTLSLSLPATVGGITLDSFSTGESWWAIPIGGQLHLLTRMYDTDFNDITVVLACSTTGGTVTPLSASAPYKTNFLYNVTNGPGGSVATFDGHQVLRVATSGALSTEFAGIQFYTAPVLVNGAWWGAQYSHTPELWRQVALDGTILTEITLPEPPFGGNVVGDTVTADGFLLGSYSSTDGTGRQHWLERLNLSTLVADYVSISGVTPDASYLWPINTLTPGGVTPPLRMRQRNDGPRRGGRNGPSSAQASPRRLGRGGYA